MTGKRSLVTRLLADGFDHGEAAAVVSTDTSAEDVRESLADAVGRSVTGEAAARRRRLR